MWFKTKNDFIIDTKKCDFFWHEEHKEYFNVFVKICDETVLIGNFKTIEDCKDYLNEIFLTLI